ncbi:MAG: MATE family efflux transporter [Oligoflexales bacterium]
MSRLDILKYWVPIVKLAAPIFLSLIGIQAMEIIDAVMIGRLGVHSLAAGAFSNGIVSIFIIIGTGFSTAVSTLVARTRAKHNPKDLSSIITTSLWITLLVGIFLTLVLELVRNHLHLFGQDPEVIDLAPGYFLLIECSLLPQMLFQIYKQFTDGMGNSAEGSIALLLSLFLNAFFNWIFIYGNLGIPALGLMGAGLGTLLSRVFLVSGFLVFLSFRSEYRSIKFIALPGASLKKYAPLILSIGVPASLQYLFEAGVFSMATIMAGWIDAITLASHQILLKVSSACFMLPLSLSFAASIQVGKEVGQNNAQQAKKMGFAVLGLTLVMMSLVGICLWYYRFQIPYAFVDVREVLELSASLLFIAALFQIFDGTQAVAIGILRGYLDTKVPVLFTFISYWVVSFPAAYIFAFVFDTGLKGLWYGLMLGLISSSVLLNIRFYRLSKSH